MQCLDSAVPEVNRCARALTAGNHLNESFSPSGTVSRQKCGWRGLDPWRKSRKLFRDTQGTSWSEWMKLTVSLAFFEICVQSFIGADHVFGGKLQSFVKVFGQTARKSFEDLDLRKDDCRPGPFAAKVLLDRQSTFLKFLLNSRCEQPWNEKERLRTTDNRKTRMDRIVFSRHEK